MAQWTYYVSHVRPWNGQPEYYQTVRVENPDGRDPLEVAVWFRQKSDEQARDCISPDATRTFKVQARNKDEALVAYGIELQKAVTAERERALSTALDV